MENNFNLDMQKLCDMQMELWEDMKRDLMTMKNPTDEGVITVFRKHLRETHHDAVLQLIKVKSAIDKAEMILEETTD